MNTASAFLAPHTNKHTSRKKKRLLEPQEKAVRDRLGLPITTLHLVWGRVVPDIPAFCRELVAALADE